jgi:protein-S-isoprenylcysteine O-methyltransferase Ste14
MGFKASPLEFRLRFLILGLIFAGCFWVSGYESRGHFGYLWILITSWLSRIDGLSNDTNALVVKVVVSALVLLAAALRTWATAYFDARTHSATVIAVGPYAYLRNPLYLATILLAFALAPLNGPWEALTLVVLITVFTLRLIGREEEDLAAAQGAEYLRYRAAVPSLWPWLRREAVELTRARPQWAQALVGELWFWGCAGAVITYAATFRMDLFYRILLISLGVYFIVRGMTPKHEQQLLKK